MRWRCFLYYILSVFEDGSQGQPVHPVNSVLIGQGLSLYICRYYGGTSDKGPSEIGTTSSTNSVQWNLQTRDTLGLIVCPLYRGYPYLGGTKVLEWGRIKLRGCPYLRGSLISGSSIILNTSCTVLVVKTCFAFLTASVIIKMAHLFTLATCPRHTYFNVHTYASIAVSCA